MNERDTIHSRLPFAMQETEAGPYVYSSQTPAARAGDSGHESRHILVHTGDPMSALFAALRPRGLSGGLISLAAAIALLYYGQPFLVTVCTAVIINFILEPFVGLLTRVRVPRALASFIVCSFAVCAVYFAGLGVYKQGSRLAEDVPKYAERIGNLSDGVLTKLESMEGAASSMVARRRPSQPSHQAPAKRRSTPEPVVPVGPAPGVQEVRIQPERPPLAEFIHSHLASLYETLLMASFVPFLVYFMLSWRDHIQPAFLQLFEGPDRNMAAKSLEGIASMVRAFVVGNFLLGVLLAAASTVFFWAFRLPYPILIGPLSGFLSLVPAVGVPLALAPPLLAALTVYGTPAPYLIIVGVVELIHLLTMNLLYPKIVGQRVHLNPLVVAVAMMFWGVLWGAAGLILAIPLTAGIKAVCDHVKSLERYGRLLGD
jgi:predicted PurR-regulated permease PerM